MTALKRRAALTVLATTIYSPAFADQPGDNLDSRVSEMAACLRDTDANQAPGFELRDSEGKPVRRSDFSDKAVIVQFICGNCPGKCPRHSEKSPGMGKTQATRSFLTRQSDRTDDATRPLAWQHGLEPTAA